MAELIVVHTYLTEVDAQLAHSALEGAGIEAAIRRDDCGGLEPQLAMTRGVSVLVAADRADEARDILDIPAIDSDAE